MSDFQQRMKEQIQTVNEKLEGLLCSRGGEYDSVLEAMRYSVMNGGKRIRPLLVLEFCRLFGGDPNDALPFACAVEMIHTYSLIHDDLPCMDDDDLRRGRPSCHKQFGEATALLAGDGLLTLAFQTAASSELGKRRPAAALSCIAQLASLAGVDGMVGGQVMDLAMEQKDSVSVDSLRTMHRLKTGALIQASCKMGAICAGAGKKEIADAACYGENLGLAFQTVDDILDVTGSEEELGKPIGSDEENHKVTFLTLYGMDKAKELAANMTQQALGILEQYENSDFLKQLTETLLTRRK